MKETHPASLSSSLDDHLQNQVCAYSGCVELIQHSDGVHQTTISHDGLLGGVIDSGEADGVEDAFGWDGRETADDGLLLIGAEAVGSPEQIEGFENAEIGLGQLESEAAAGDLEIPSDPVGPGNTALDSDR